MNAILSFKSISCGPASSETVKPSPIVVIVIPFVKSPDLTFASTTTCVANVSSSVAASISPSELTPSSESNDANASLVGANTVNVLSGLLAAANTSAS